MVFILAISFYEVFFLGKTFKVTNTVSQALSTGVYGQGNNYLNFIPTHGVDSAVLEEPTFEFIRENLKQGILPLWNPHQACGYPLISMMETGIFYPLNFIMYIFPSFWSWDILMLMRFFLAGYFTYWFMRTLSFTRIPCVCAAICFMLSGPMVLIQNWTVNVIILAPLLLIALEKLIRSPVSGRVVFLAVVVAMTFFAGHPENIFFVNLYGLLFFFFRLFSLRKKVSCRKVCFSLLAAYFLGLASAAVTILPFLADFTGMWHNHPSDVGLLAEQGQERMLSVALPHFFQKFPLTIDWILAGWSGGYLGAIPLVLVFLSLFSKQKNGLNYFFAGFALILFGKTYGWPIVNWIGSLPLFNMCRFSLHTVHLIAFSTAVCAGMGYREVLMRPGAFIKGFIFSIAIIAFAFWNRSMLVNHSDVRIADQSIIFAGSLLVLFLVILWIGEHRILKKYYIGVLIVSLLFIELFCYINHDKLRKFDSFPKVPYIEALQSQPEKFRAYGLGHEFFPNTAAGYGLDDIGIFNSLLGIKYVHFINALVLKGCFMNNLRPSAFRSDCPNQRSEFLDLMNLKYFISPHFLQADRLVTPPFTINQKGVVQETDRLVYSKEVNIYERVTFFPRSFVVHRAVFDADEKTSLAALVSNVDHLRSRIVVDHAIVPLINAQLIRVPEQDNSKVEIIKYGSNELEIGVVMSDPGFLVLSDAFHPQWKAYDNGKDVKIYEADILFRAVFLGAGKHLVKFVFVPKYFYLGIIISALSVMCMIFLVKKGGSLCFKGCFRFKNRKYLLK